MLDISKNMPQDRLPAIKFYYDKNTGYALISKLDIKNKHFFSQPNISDKLKASSFFKNPLEESSEGRYTRRSVQAMIEKYSRENQIKIMLGQTTFYNVDQLQILKQHLKGFLIHPSGVLISNEQGGVKISKQGKSVNLQDALIQYFEHENDLKIEEIRNGVVNLEQLEIDKSMSNIRDDLLKKSKILNAFIVLDGNADKESVICGVAKDSKSKESFYWMTEIKDGISTLLGYSK